VNEAGSRRIAFGVMAGSPADDGRESWIRALALVRSLRELGGAHSDAMFVVAVPDAPEWWDADAARMLARSEANILRFELSRADRSIFFGPQARAAAAIESLVEGSCDVLAYMVADTLVLRDPAALEMPDGVDVLYRPVHVANIGSPSDQPLDEFWSAVYRHCGVRQEPGWTVLTCVEGISLRPYLNSGSLVLRPQMGVFREWVTSLEALVETSKLASFIAADRRYHVFAHQALLSAVVTARFSADRAVALPESVNYPRHLHDRYPADRRPTTLDELTTCRYEYPFEVCRWTELLPPGEGIGDWLVRLQAEVRGLTDVERLDHWRRVLTERGASF
jgi:hypothetical protein